jgi:hypothetical protein
VAAADADRRIVAAYPRHFDVAWTAAIQLAASAAFLAVFWAVLWLGAGLFQLVRIELFAELLRRRDFALPVSMTVVAAAIHVTDVRSASSMASGASA